MACQSGSEQRAAEAQKFLREIRVLVDEKLDAHLPPVSERPSRIHEAMRYSVFAGGKRLRPGLCYAAWKAFGGKGEEIFYATSALEMFHTFSLIHDDLPCVDDDDLRRGRPTAHRQYDEATAVMAGDALCVHAFALLAKTGAPEVVATMADALGTGGMIGGEITDIESEGKKVDLATVDYIHDCKTARLIEASLVVGAQIAGAPKPDVEALARFGRKIGLAFQVVDDVLDVVSTTEQLGKDAGSDVEQGKATYPALVGVEASRKRARELVDQALVDLEQVHADTTVLRNIADFIVQRVN